MQKENNTENTVTWINLGSIKNRKYDFFTKKIPIRNRKKISNIPKIYTPTYEDRVQKLLNSKIDDEMVETVYSEDGECLPLYLNEIEDSKIFNKYYDSNDQDVQANEEIYVSLLNNLRKDDPEELNRDKFLLHLDKFVERYRSTKNNLDILIPPNTNRYHTNYLFKKLVDYSIDNNCIYSHIDQKTGDIYPLDLINVNFKDAFYEFCYENTYKNNNLLNIF